MSSSPVSSSIVAQGVSPPASTVTVKMQPDGDGDSLDGDGDGGGQRISGDDEAGSDNDDEVAEVSNRNGKRKRPISVSYVQYCPPSCALTYPTCPILSCLLLSHLVFSCPVLA